ncbi:phage baseplate protein [Enterobacter asburiae]|uniref:phage baseplate protein n=1 Tax=Enterobacter asburiae TaxID=61645 RepID=UPI003907ED14
MLFSCTHSVIPFTVCSSCDNTFKLSGIISETPMRLEKDLLYSAGVNGARISQTIEYLDKIFDSRQPITLATEHKVYDNVILSGISCNINVNSQCSLILNLNRTGLLTKRHSMLSLLKRSGIDLSAVRWNRR